jgi:uncharacterized protein YvpB
MTIDNANLAKWLKNFQRNTYFLEYLNLSRYELSELKRYCNQAIKKRRLENKTVEAYNDLPGGFIGDPWLSTLEAAIKEIQRLEGNLNAKEYASDKDEPQNLSARTAAAIIWALNTWQPQTITKHIGGVEQGLKNFNIPTNYKASTIHKHVKAAANGGKNDPLQSTYLAEAAFWLENNGFQEAANRAFELLGEQRHG